VRESGLEDSVSFLGSRSDIPSLMKSFDVLVVPSLNEAFGYINIEAGVCGLPVVASRIGGIPEVVIDKETGLLVEAENVEQIAKACCQLLSSREERGRLGGNAKKRVEEKFSADSQIPKWNSLVSELLGN